MLSCLYLGAKCLLGVYERHKNSHTRDLCPPIPLPEKPAFATTDVSILIPTINTPDAFTECMQLWLANAPKEIIIVTIPRDLQRVRELLAPLGDSISTPISVFTVPKPGRRAQMSLALKKASGSIVAYVDDDTYWPSNKVLPYLLAGFNDPAVGGVMGRQSAFVPVHRRKPSIVTASEVATMRALSSTGDSNASMYATERMVWCLTGRTLLARSAALQNESFTHALTHETWRGRPINTGDDGFVTHWLHNRGWRLVFQSAPEAEVLTLVESAPNFARQLVRWRRSGYRTHVVLMMEEPGFWRLRREHPGYALKILRFLVRPLSTLVDAAAWIQTVYHWPYFAMLLAGYYLYRFATAALAFHGKNPWVGYRHLWAVVAVDHVYRIINLYVILTLGVEGWLTRDDSARDDSKEDS